jgi:hypothetical protein
MSGYGNCPVVVKYTICPATNEFVAAIEADEFVKVAVAELAAATGV